MKKNIIYIALGAATLFSMSSCYDLDRYPADKLSAGTFWKTQAHADQAMMGVYSELQNDDVYGIYFGLDCLGNVGMGYDNASYQTIARGTTDARTSFYSNKWKALYDGVARANTVIQNVPNITMTDELKARYIGEAKFMRALFYFNLLDFYGGVPLYDEKTVIETDFNNMTKPRSTAEETRSFILSDLDAAVAVLPDSWESSNAGRATKDAAIALKGKVLLYAKKYSEAAAEFEKIVSGNRHQLYSDYTNLFKPGGDESSEMIFAVQNLGGVGQDYGMPMTFYMGTRSSFGSDWNNVMLSTDFVDSYEWKDGRSFNWEEIIPGFTTNQKIKDATFRATLTSDKTKVSKYPEAKDKLLAMYDQRDPRMQATVILPYTWFKGWVSNARKDCEYVIGPTGAANEKNGMIRVNGNYETYIYRKFVAEYDMNGAINNRADTPINFPIIRYADVLLMLAECDNELGKLDDAVALINKVRSRVGMPGINSGATWLEARTKDAVFSRIRHERTVEFAGEGLSYSDLRRWGLLMTLNGKGESGFTGTKTYYTRSIQDRDYLWPIPGGEIDKNSALTQNPGWN